MKVIRIRGPIIKLGMGEDAAAQLLGGWLKDLRAERKSDSEDDGPPAVFPEGASQEPSEASEPGTHGAADEERQGAEDAAMELATGGVDLTPLTVLESMTTAEALLGAVSQFAEELKALPRALTSAAYLKHAERLGVDLVLVDNALSGGAS